MSLPTLSAFTVHLDSVEVITFSPNYTELNVKNVLSFLPPIYQHVYPFGVYIAYTRQPSPKNRVLAAQHVWEATSNNVVIATLVVDDSVVRASNKGTRVVVDCKFVLHYLNRSKEQRICIRFSKQVCKLMDLNMERIVKRDGGTGEVLRVVAKRYVRKLVRFAL